MLFARVAWTLKIPQVFWTFKVYALSFDVHSNMNVISDTVTLQLPHFRNYRGISPLNNRGYAI